MASTPPDESWQRLGRALIARRVDLNPKYKSREAFARATGMDYRVLFDIENARRTNFGPTTIARIERAYRLAGGSMEKFRANPDLTEFPDRVGEASINLADTAGRLSSVPDIQLGAPGDPDPRDVIPGDPISAEKGEVQIWATTVLPWEIRRDLIVHLRWLDQQYDRQQPETRRENGTEG